MAIVAILELGYGDTNLFEVLEDTAIVISRPYGAI